MSQTLRQTVPAPHEGKKYTKKTTYIITPILTEFTQSLGSSKSPVIARLLDHFENKSTLEHGATQQNCPTQGTEDYFCFCRALQTPFPFPITAFAH